MGISWDITGYSGNIMGYDYILYEWDTGGYTGYHIGIL